MLQLPLLLLARWLGRSLRWEAVLLGWALPLLLLLPWLDGKRVLAPTGQLLEVLPGLQTPAPATLDPHRELNDIVYCLIPWELEVRHALAAARLPLWSDLVDGGSSPWSNPQAQALSPVAMLARALPIQHSLLGSLALKILVALQGAWVLCRRVGAGRGAAAIGGASFALGGAILGWSLFPHSTAAAWAPWVVAGVVVAMRRPRPRALVALALATAALLLSGQPEIAAGAVALAAFVGLWRAQARPRGPRRCWRRRSPACWAWRSRRRSSCPSPRRPGTACVPASGSPAGCRRSRPAAARAAGSSRRGGRSSRARFSPLVYGKPYGPTFGGPWAWPIALSAYTGLVALAAAAAAALGRKRRRIAAPFLLTWVVALVLASRFVPLEQLLFRIPPLRVPELSRMLPFGCLGLAVAAALGVEQLRRARRRARAGRGRLRRVGAGAAAHAAMGRRRAGGSSRRPGVGSWRCAASPPASRCSPPRCSSTSCLGGGRSCRPRTRRASTRSPARSAPSSAELRHGPWRAVAEDLLVYPSLLPVYGIADVRPHNPLAVREQLAVLGRAFGFAPGGAYESYFSRFGNVEHPLLDFLNVRVVLTNPYLPAKRRLERVYGPDPRVFEVMRNPDALPRWFLPTAAEAVPKRRVLDWIGGLVDARRVALLAEETHGWLPAPRAWQADAVRALREVPGDLELRVGGAGERLLATSLPGPRGWSARGGDGKLPLLTVNGAFLGVRVPAGVERVRLRYVPPGLWPGVALAVAGALGLLVVATRSAPAWSRGSGRCRAGSRR